MAWCTWDDGARVLRSLAIGWTAAIAVFLLARELVPSDIYVDAFDSKWAQYVAATHCPDSVIACYKGDIGCVYTAGFAPGLTFFTARGHEYRPGTVFLLGLLIVTTPACFALTRRD